MATQDYAASIQGVSIRATRLDATGNLLNNPGDSYTTTAFIRTSFTPEYEAGNEITEKNADGTVGVVYQSPDTLKRIKFELAISEPDPELTQLLSGGLLLRKNQGTFAAPVRKSIGWSLPAVGDDPAGYGVAIECWSFAIKGGKKSATFPYFHWIFPYVKMRQSGDRVIENNVLANTFEGYGLGNTSFGVGPDGRWEFPAVTDRAYSYARSNWAPTGRNGFYTWHAAITAAINTAVLLANVVTLTSTLPHDFLVGDTVTVSGVGAPYDGVFVVATAPSTTTFTYAVTAANVVSAAVSPVGAAVVGPGSRTVTDFATETSTTLFNVPGNVAFNADNPTDFIVAAATDPLV